MSWSFSGIGLPKTVAAKVATEVNIPADLKQFVQTIADTVPAETALLVETNGHIDKISTWSNVNLKIQVLPKLE